MKMTVQEYVGVVQTPDGEQLRSKRFSNDALAKQWMLDKLYELDEQGISATGWIEEYHAIKDIKPNPTVGGRAVLTEDDFLARD